MHTERMASDCSVTLITLEEGPRAYKDICSFDGCDAVITGGWRCLRQGQPTYLGLVGESGFGM